MVDESIIEAFLIIEELEKKTRKRSCRRRIYHNLAIQRFSQ